MRWVATRPSTRKPDARYGQQVKISTRLATALVAGGALLGCTAILGDYDVAAGPDSSNEAGPDGTTPDTEAGREDDAGVDAPIVCSSPEVACGNACATLATSGDHCGACGHSCGGGLCEAGRCKPAELYRGTTDVGPLAVGDVDIFFSPAKSETRLVSCPKTGCKLAPTQVAMMGFGIQSIVVPAKGNVTFISALTNGSGTERPAIYTCAASGCPSPPPSFASDGLNGISRRFRVAGDRLFYDLGGTGICWSTCAPGAGGCTAPTKLGSLTRNTSGFSLRAGAVYFADAPSRGGAISRCQQDDPACTPTVLVPADNSDLSGMDIAGDKLFWTKPGRDGYSEGKLFVCDLPACAAPTTLAVGLDLPRDLFVDASGAYWLNAGNKIQRCLPNGCLGGAQDFAGPLDEPHSVVADASFVYWAEKVAIRRLAK